MLFGLLQFIFHTIMLPSVASLIIAVLFDIEFFKAAVVVGVFYAALSAYVTVIVGHKMVVMLQSLSNNEQGDQADDQQ